MSSTLAGAFGVAALFVAVLALVFAIQALRARTVSSDQVAPAAPPEPEPQPAQPEAKPGTVKSELRKLGKDLEVTRGELKETLQHLSVVRYDAFGETGGKLSWSMAILTRSDSSVRSSNPPGSKCTSDPIEPP